MDKILEFLGEKIKQGTFVEVDLFTDVEWETENISGFLKDFDETTLTILIDTDDEEEENGDRIIDKDDVCSIYEVD